MWWWLQRSDGEGPSRTIHVTESDGHNCYTVWCENFIYI